MFQRGDQIVYGIHGVCKVLDVELKNVNRKSVEYYVLMPVNQPKDRFYVPTQNQSARAKMRPLLTKGQIDEILGGPITAQEDWLNDENQRKQYYRELINEADCGQLLRMIRALYRHKEHQLEKGRKFHLCDENFLRDAERLLFSEFSLVLGIPQEEVSFYIQSQME